MTNTDIGVCFLCKTNHGLCTIRCYYNLVKLWLSGEQQGTFHAKEVTGVYLKSAWLTFPISVNYCNTENNPKIYYKTLMK